MKSSRSTPQNTSSLRSGQAPDQHSTRLALQSCLKHLDRLEYRVHEEIQGVRSLFRELLDNCQSDATTENSGECNSTVDSKAGFDGLNTIHCLVPQPAPHGTSFRVTGLLSEGTGSPQGLLPYNARSSANYVAHLQHSMYSEAFSASCDPRVTELPSDHLFPKRLQCVPRPIAAWDVRFWLWDRCGTLPGHLFGGTCPVKFFSQTQTRNATASQAKDKVKCTWNGCSALVNKDNLTRHVGEYTTAQTITATNANCFFLTDQDPVALVFLPLLDNKGHLPSFLPPQPNKLGPKLIAMTDEMMWEFKTFKCGLLVSEQNSRNRLREVVASGVGDSLPAQGGNTNEE
ncbi:uncharacterized protein F5147DRAFT_761581 [Suillus discolor]|uniref:Uncharacterized protein n=1 Tax=Suillus discolor TaxID=1912936 RepID=A0A9P7JT28_9AGAM|nr:uncharacterized protein F5147DRAFT_761581 [Suillus discolor]KAG2106747.1 hypothetical protein F5147DRAFT_761581 [Suillus discolor]